MNSDSQLSGTFTAASSELPKDPDVVLVEETDVGDPVPHHGYPIGAHPKGEPRDLVWS